MSDHAEPSARRLHGPHWGTLRATARHTRRNLISTAVAHLPDTLYSELTDELERDGTARSIDLLAIANQAPIPRFETRTLYSSQVDVVPAAPPDLPEMGRWSPPIQVFRMEGVDLDVDSGLAFFNGCVVEQSRSARMAAAADLARLTGATRRIRSTSRIHFDGAIAPLGEAWDVYYHLLLETTARMLHLASAAPDLTLVTATELSPAVTRLLSRTGLRVAEVPEGTVATADHVWVCGNADRFWPRQGDIDAIRRAFIPSTAGSRVADGRLYISRSRSARSLRGEAALEDYLADRGFVIAHLQDLSIDEQVDLLARSSLVVGPHGAGFANMVFMSPGGRVVELATRAWWNLSYRAMAPLLGLDYRLSLLPENGVFGSADDAIAALEQSGVLDQ